MKGLGVSVTVSVTELGFGSSLGPGLETPGVRNAWVRKG